MTEKFEIFRHFSVLDVVHSLLAGRRFYDRLRQCRQKNRCWAAWSCMHAACYCINYTVSTISEKCAYKFLWSIIFYQHFSCSPRNAGDAWTASNCSSSTHRANNNSTWRHNVCKHHKKLKRIKLLRILAVVGLVKVAEWCEVMSSIFSMELPWHSLRSKLAKVNSAGLVDYHSTFDDFKLQLRHNPEVIFTPLTDTHT